MNWGTFDKSAIWIQQKRLPVVSLSGTLFPR